MADFDKNRWNTFVQAADDATCYHQAGWKEVIEKTFGHKTFYLISEDGSKKIKGILPLVQLKSLLFGNFLVSLPYFNYGGACVSNQEDLHKLLNEAKIIAAETNAKHIEFRHTRHLYEDLPVKTTKVAMKLDLPEDAEQMLKSFPSKLRSQIKRPQKEGMVAKIGKADQLENFYAIFSQNMRDLGTPVYSINFFKNILKTFPDSTWICTVLLKDGLPVASAFLVGFKGKIEIPWASSLSKV